MRPALVAALVVLISSAHVRADEITLKDGSTLRGRVVATSGDDALVRLDDGETIRLKKGEIASTREERAERAAGATRPAGTIGGWGTDALARAFREGLAERTRLGGGELRTVVPARTTDGGFAMSAAARALDLAKPRCLDRRIDDVARGLYEKPATAAERFRALSGLAGAVAWLEVDVVSVSRGTEPSATVEPISTVVRGRFALRGRGWDGVARNDRLRLPVLILLRTEEGNRYLSAGASETLDRWPIEAVVIAGEQGAAARAPGTVARDASGRALEARVREWLELRKDLVCPRCKKTRELTCVRCDGAGGCERIVLNGGYVRWAICSRCGGRGARTCGACKDGFDERRLDEALTKFAGWGPGPITSFLRAGVSVVLAGDGRRAEVTCWVRTLEGRPPASEVTQWVRDDAGTWKLGAPASELAPASGLTRKTEPAPEPPPLERPGGWIFLDQG